MCVFQELRGLLQEALRVYITHRKVCRAPETPASSDGGSEAAFTPQSDSRQGCAAIARRGAGVSCVNINITVESCSFATFESGCAATDCATVKTEAGSTAGSSKMNGTRRFFGHGVRIRRERRLKEMPQSATTSVTVRQERNRFFAAMKEQELARARRDRIPKVRRTRTNAHKQKELV